MLDARISDCLRLVLLLQIRVLRSCLRLAVAGCLWVALLTLLLLRLLRIGKLISWLLMARRVWWCSSSWLACVAPRLLGGLVERWRLLHR